MIEELSPGDARMAQFQSLAPPMYRAELVNPQAVCLLLRREGAPAARCSLEIIVDPDGAQTAILGHYEACDPEAGVRLLRKGCDRAAAEGATRVIGPMNGSTWARYRLTLDAGPEATRPEAASFLSEPQNSPTYPEHFLSAGFRVCARYQSRIVTRLPGERKWSLPLEHRVRRAGITISTACPERYEQEIEELYYFCSRVFAGNEYYRPIPLELFRRGYAALRPMLDPRLVLLARNGEGDLVGICFAFPDRPGAPDLGRRVVLKTLAAAPEHAALGIGAHLADKLHQRAAELGYSAVVHALMHDDNDSVKLSHRFHSRLFRQYALYQWNP